MTRETFLAGVLADATRTFRYRSGVAWLLGYPDIVGPEPVPARPPANALPYVRSRRSSRQTAWAVPPLDDWVPHSAATTAPMPTASPSAFGDVRGDGAETAPPEEFFVVAHDSPHHDAVVARSLPEGWAAPEAPGVHRTTRVPGGDLAGLHGTPRTGRAAPEARDVDHTAARPAGTASGDLADGQAAPTLRDVAIVALPPRSTGAEVLGSEPDDVQIASLVERSRYWRPRGAPEDLATGRTTTGQQDAAAGGYPSAGDVSAGDISVPAPPTETRSPEVPVPVAAEMTKPASTANVSAGHSPVRTPSAKRREPGVPVPVAADPSGPRSGRLRLAATPAIADSTSEAFDDAPWPRARLATNADAGFAPVAAHVPSLEPFSEPLSSQAAMAPVPDVVQILPAGEEIYGGATAFWTRRHMRRWQIGLLR